MWWRREVLIEGLQASGGANRLIAIVTKSFKLRPQALAWVELVLLGIILLHAEIKSWEIEVQQYKARTFFGFKGFHRALCMGTHIVQFGVPRISRQPKMQTYFWLGNTVTGEAGSGFSRALGCCSLALHFFPLIMNIPHPSVM